LTLKRRVVLDLNRLFPHFVTNGDDK
jgi:hypothetical protein